MAICLYNQHESDRMKSCNNEYVESYIFNKLEESAKSKGYRHATLSEIHASAESAPWAIELFSWRGGLWVKH